jgi:anti-sigma-K factor RskA
MSFKSRFEDETAGRNARPEAAGGEVGDEELSQALKDFRLSVRAWSDAELTRPRTAPATRRGSLHGWRLAAGWALGCVLAAGGVSGGLYERHQRAEIAKIKAQQEIAQQKQLAEQKAREEEDLLAKVDSDVARDVPSAMEPLAQLMDADDVK